MPAISLKMNDPDYDLEHVLNRFHALTGFVLTYWKKEEDVLGVYVISEHHVDFSMTADVRANLAEEGINVVKTEEYIAHCTLIARDLPRSLQEKSLEDIANDISSCNGVKVIRVDWKGEDSLFIEFNTIEDADKVLKSSGGMKLSYERSIVRLKKKPYLKVPQCARCFSYEHEIDTCPKTVRTCYHCGEEGHGGDECSTDYVRCVNCHGDHVAFAFKCPKRKQKEREMLEDGWAPDSVDTGKTRGNKVEDEEESTRRAEEEVSVILGVGRLLLEDPDQREDLQETSSSTACAPEPGQGHSTDPDPASSPNKPSVMHGVACDSPCDTSNPIEATSGERTEASLESASGTGLQQSPGGSLKGKTDDPLPVSPRRTSYPEERPPSRLGDPVTSPIVRPMPRKSPQKSPSQSGGTV
ncbi:hypothetical protein O3P69_012753 [Scylla paramamosain]|uniref:CCHC-type domain-containing protein n=1 Tax=Scylla paramamosain TaxID=85552 RepID=A0AAW0SGV5_SCYPA